MQQPPVIFLIGPRASGKTTLGTALAERLRRPFADTDAWIHNETRESVAALVERAGWAEFRRMESRALRAVSLPGHVVATGGGMVLAEENRRFMREHGLVLYLCTPGDVLAARLAASPQAEQRPSLTGQCAVAEAAKVAEERDPLYREAAHHVLDASLPLEALLLTASALARRTPDPHL